MPTTSKSYKLYHNILGSNWEKWFKNCSAYQEDRPIEMHIIDRTINIVLNDKTILKQIICLDNKNYNKIFQTHNIKI